jgi:two-component system sensor histidine kinase MtrB
MQRRVVTSAIAVGIVTVLGLGTFISTSIRDGLFDKRIAQLDHQFSRSASVVRDTLAASTATSSDDVQALILSLVVERLGAGAYAARGSFLAGAGDTAVGVNNVASFYGMDAIVTSNLRAATLASDHQMWQSVTIPSASSESGNDEPGVVFGTVVEVPSYGRFGLYLLYSLQPEQDTLHFVQTTLAGGAGAILAIIGIITWLFTRQAVAPVQRAAATAARLADGNLDERMPRIRHDEMDTLARSFNEMAESLQDQIARLEALSTAQRRFVSDVSHELRTPLTTVRMASEMIYDSKDELNPGAKRSAELMQNQLDRFEELLADLLEISRHDAGAAILEAEQTNMTSLVEMVLESAEPLAHLKAVATPLYAPAEPVMVDMDARRVERILRNLVTNAIEHAEGNPVEVHVAGNEDCVAVAVRDHGVGLSSEDVVHVFDRFWRADPSRVRTTGGTGLGLSISLEDAHLHSGTLEAWGKKGEGSSFRLVLPRHTGLPVTDPPLPLVPETPGSGTDDPSNAEGNGELSSGGVVSPTAIPTFDDEVV